MELYRATARCRLRVPAVCRWQMAMARASEASIGSGGTERPRSRVTMCCTCCFSARPYPTTDDLIVSGAASSEAATRGAFSLSVGGSREQSTDWLLDGNDNNQLDEGGIAIFSSIH